MKTIHAFKLDDNWGYSDNAKDIPAEASVSFQQDFDSLTADEETYFCIEVLTFNESEKTVTFSREKFNSDVRNVIYMDMETDFASRLVRSKACSVSVYWRSNGHAVQRLNKRNNNLG